MFKIATVCSGIGSPEQALKDLNVPHEIAFACEIDKYARQTYLANFKPNLMLTDMTKHDWIGDEYYSDLYIGGIPCQAFSLAGKRLGELDPRGLLFYDFYRYVKNQQPKVFIIENVKGLLSDAGGNTFNNWVQLLGQSMNTHLNMFNHEDSLLYNLHFKVLNSKDFGVPQNRERVFLVGVRNDLPNTFRFPIGFRLTKRLKDILEVEVDEKYYLSDKMIEGLTLNNSGNQLGFINQDTQASKVYSTESVSPTVCAGTHGYALGYIQEPNISVVGRVNSSQDGQIFDINGISQCLSSGHGNCPKIIEPTCIAMRGRGESGNIKQQLEECKDGITNTITSVQKDNLIVDYTLIEHRGHLNKEPNFISTGIVPTLRAQSHGHETKVVLKQRIRKLTPTECMRLQGFPDTFNKPCSDSQQYKMAGNSITTFTIKAIIENLLPILQAEETQAKVA